MSLMNDALRKKSHETSRSPAAASFIDASQQPRMSKHWLVGLAAMILLTTTAFYGAHLIQSSSSSSLLVKKTQPGRNRASVEYPANNAANGQLQPEATPMAALADRQPKPIKNENQAEENRLTAAELQTAPTASAVDAKPPRSGDAASASALPPTDAQPVHTTASSAVHEPDAVSRTFEPGPVPETSAGEKTRLVVPRQPPSPARPALSHAPEASEVIAGQNTRRAASETAPLAGNDDLFYEKARSYHRGNHFDDAIRLYRKVLKTTSNHPGAMLNLAAAYMQQGNYVAAHPLLKRLERSRPRPPGVLLNLAIASIGMGAPEKGLEDLERAAAQSDASPWEIRFHRAVALAHMNRLPEALVLYREAATERPDDPRLRFNLAVTCDALGLYPEAISHYEAVLRAPSPPSATDKATITLRIRTIGRYLGTAQPAVKGQ